MHATVGCQFGMKGCDQNVALFCHDRVAFMRRPCLDLSPGIPENRRPDENTAEFAREIPDFERCDERIHLPAVRVTQYLDVDQSPALNPILLLVTEHDRSGAGSPGRQSRLDGSTQLVSQVVEAHDDLKGG